MKIGFLDDEYNLFESMASTFKEYEIELVKLDSIQDITRIEEIRNYILENHLEALIVDYKLDKLQSKNKKGTKFIRMMSEVMPEFPFFMLTNYPDEGINEFTILRTNIFQKEIFQEDDDSEEIKNFVETIKNAITCFYENIKRIEKEYSILLKIRREKKIDEQDNLHFINLYEYLSKYNKVDKLPREMLESSFQRTINNLQETIKRFSEELEKNE